MRDLEELNAASDLEAHAAFLQCCGSTKWARRMVERRPFKDRSELFVTADAVWKALETDDWLEAFAAHPKIGEEKSSDSSHASRWATEEQSGARLAEQETLEELADANREYERHFGYIFIVCATGKSADEMLGLLRSRLANDPFTELPVAAEEQRRITRLRLEKLLSQ